MTNPFAAILLQAYEAYHKINPSAASAASAAAASAASAAAASAASAAQRHTIPKSLLYIIGTSIITAILYKSLKNRTATLFHFLTPFKYLLNRRKTDTQEIPFEDKYFNEYDEWSAKQERAQTPTAEDNSLEQLFYITIRETINDFYGDVIMCYDHATFSFAYYGRTANIPYKYLETISRKYMIETNAPREIHVDIRDEYKKAKERTIPAPANANANANANTNTNTNTNDPTTDDGNVFVKLKSYNTVSNLNIHTTTNDTNEKTHKFVTPSGTATEAKASTSSSTKIIREKANRYSYRGKIHDFDENHKRPFAATATATATDADADEVKDYADFKKQMMNMRSAL